MFRQQDDTLVFRLNLSRSTTTATRKVDDGKTLPSLSALVAVLARQAVAFGEGWFTDPTKFTTKLATKFTTKFLAP